jgi:hypothetical protein
LGERIHQPQKFGKRRRNGYPRANKSLFIAFRHHCLPPRLLHCPDDALQLAASVARAVASNVAAVSVTMNAEKIKNRFKA